MPATVVEVGDAIVQHLNGESFPLSFTAERKWIHELSKPNLSSYPDVKVLVTPASLSRAALARTRGASAPTHTIVFVRTWVWTSVDMQSSSIDADIDALADLTELIQLSLEAGGPFGGAQITDVTSDDDPLSLYDPELLENQSEYQALIEQHFIKV